MANKLFPANSLELILNESNRTIRFSPNVRQIHWVYRDVFHFVESAIWYWLERKHHLVVICSNHKIHMFALRILGHLEHILSSICSLIRWRRKWKWWRDLKTEVRHQICHQKRSSPKVDSDWSTRIIFLGKTSLIINSKIERKCRRNLRQYFLQFLGSPNVWSPIYL